ncbi:hypothetical protein LPJ66_009205, partial [Kickxella alabastrina]
AFYSPSARVQVLVQLDQGCVDFASLLVFCVPGRPCLLAHSAFLLGLLVCHHHEAPDRAYGQAPLRAIRQLWQATLQPRKV